MTIDTALTARENLDFGLDDTVPRYWFNNDPFKTRICDGMQVAFPDGERYFITSVRRFREFIQDPKLLEDVRLFIRQEGQHGMAHTRYNEMLGRQGMPMAEMLARFNEVINHRSKHWSPKMNLALTAAAEHFTALLAEAFFGNRKVTEGSDPRIQALFAWHAIEEMEHRDVAFDVMKSVSGVGYWQRCLAMVIMTYDMNRVMFQFADRMLEADGFSWLQRKGMFLKNLNWMYGPKGVFSSFAGKILAYFRPGFHPSDMPVVHGYPNWVAAYERQGDPMEACQALLAAAR